MASSFWSGEFYFDNVLSSTRKVCIVDFNNNDILKQVGGGFAISTDKETSYNNRPFYKETERTMENIVLQLCKTDGKAWTSTDIIDINSWLFRKNFKKFQSVDFSKDYNIVYYLKAIEMKKFLNPAMEGYLEITFQSYDGYAYIIPQNSTTLSNGGTKTIYNMSNVEDIYYPKIRVTNGGNTGSTIQITNSTNGSRLTISNMNQGESVTIDCAMGSVISSSGANRFGILRDYDFIGLNKGNNSISLSGVATIEFICEFPVII